MGDCVHRSAVVLISVCVRVFAHNGMPTFEVYYLYVLSFIPAHI